MINIATLPTLLAGNDEIKTLVLQINAAETSYDELVQKIQNECQHQNNRETWEKPIRLFQNVALLSKECKDCGLVQSKPKGSDYVICQKCWSKMKDDGIRLAGEDRTHFYKCSNCGNTAFHT